MLVNLNDVLVPARRDKYAVGLFNAVNLEMARGIIEAAEEEKDELLLKYGDVVIFMSATILSHKMFSKWLGLNPNEVYHIKVDSPFTKEKRPIILNLAGKMSANRIKNTAPKTIPILQEILKKHEGDKGLIHTHSYKCQQYIVNNLYNSSFCFAVCISNQENPFSLAFFMDETLILLSICFPALVISNVVKPFSFAKANT